MAEQTDVREIDFEENLSRCWDWNGSDMSELKEFGVVIQAAYNDDDDEFVEQFCEALLSHEGTLPPLYKAKAYAYLSTIDGYDEHDHRYIARAWITEARLSYRSGYIPKEVTQWEQIIKNQEEKPLTSTGRPTTQTHPPYPPPPYFYFDPESPETAEDEPTKHQESSTEERIESDHAPERQEAERAQPETAIAEKHT